MARVRELYITHDCTVGRTSTHLHHDMFLSFVTVHLTIGPFDQEFEKALPYGTVERFKLSTAVTSYLICRMSHECCM